MPALSLAQCKPDAVEALKKKMLLLEEPVQQDQNNNNATPSKAETFADTFTHQQKVSNQDNLIHVFSQVASSTSGLHDSFATALLRLQAKLDSADERLGVIESKLEATIKARLQQRQQVTPVKRTNVLTGRSLTTSLAYLAWPVVVYVAMRAIERRSSRLGA